MKKAFIAAMTVVALVAMGCASGSKTAQTPEEAEAAAAKAAEIQGERHYQSYGRSWRRIYSGAYHDIH